MQNIQLEYFDKEDDNNGIPWHKSYGMNSN